MNTQPPSSAAPSLPSVASDALPADPGGQRKLFFWLAVPMALLSLAFLRPFCMATYHVLLDRMSATSRSTWRSNAAIGTLAMVIITFLATTVLIVLCSENAIKATPRRLQRRLSLLLWLRIASASAAVVAYCGAMVPDWDRMYHRGLSRSFLYDYAAISDRGTTNGRWIAVSSCVFCTVAAMTARRSSVQISDLLRNSMQAFPVVQPAGTVAGTAFADAGETARPGTANSAAPNAAAFAPTPPPATIAQNRHGGFDLPTLWHILLAVLVAFIAVRGATLVPDSAEMLSETHKLKNWINFIKDMSEVPVVSSGNTNSPFTNWGGQKTPTETSLLAGGAAFTSMAAIHLWGLVMWMLSIWALICVVTGYRMRKAAVVESVVLLACAIVGLLAGSYIMDVQGSRFSFVGEVRGAPSFLSLFYAPYVWLTFSLLPLLLLFCINTAIGRDLFVRASSRQA